MLLDAHLAGVCARHSFGVSHEHRKQHSSRHEVHRRACGPGRTHGDMCGADYGADGNVQTVYMPLSQWTPCYLALPRDSTSARDTKLIRSLLLRFVQVPNAYLVVDIETARMDRMSNALISFPERGKNERVALSRRTMLPAA